MEISTDITVHSIDDINGVGYRSYTVHLQVGANKYDIPGWIVCGWLDDDNMRNLRGGPNEIGAGWDWEHDDGGLNGRPLFTYDREENILIIDTNNSGMADTFAIPVRSKADAEEIESAVYAAIDGCEELFAEPLGEDIVIHIDDVIIWCIQGEDPEVDWPPSRDVDDEKLQRKLEDLESMIFEAAKDLPPGRYEIVAGHYLGGIFIAASPDDVRLFPNEKWIRDVLQQAVEDQ